MSRFAVIFSVLLLLITPVWSFAAESGNLEEIRQYFELRDTVSLVNLEMKRAMAPDSKLSHLIDSGAENDLADVLSFLEQRISQFANIETPLKYHYVKKLNGLFRETRQLQAALLVKMRADALAAVPGSTIAQPKVAVAKDENLQLQPRPYFHPIDLRTLLSPSLQNPLSFKTSPARTSIEEKKQTRTPAQQESPSSPSLADMPQKTPILVEPFEIIAPPSEVQPVKPAVKTTVKPEMKPEPRFAPKPQSAAVSSEKPAPPKPQAKAVYAAPKPPAVASASNMLVVEPLPELSAIPVVLAKPIVATSAETVGIPAVASASVAPPITVVASAAIVPPATVVATSAAEPVSLTASAGTVMRPLAVMIENHNKSRPQSGLDQADLIYEMPVEGGITRFMAIYTRLPGLLGPVRSCREYFIDRALEIDALYVHCGSSPIGYAYLKKSGINSIDEIKHSKPFFRDNTRKAPHNLYSRGAGLMDYMSEKVAMKLPASKKLLHYGPSSSSSTDIGESVRIRYHGNYTLDFKYEGGAYQRYMNNVLHIDRETSKPLQASAVVVQIAAMQVVDKAGRQEISFIGAGKAWVLEAGKMTAVTWTKKNPGELTSYKDASGQEYLFPKTLPVWVQVVSPAHKLFFNGVEKITPIADKDGGIPASSSAEIGKQG